MLKSVINNFIELAYFRENDRQSKIYANALYYGQFKNKHPFVLVSLSYLFSVPQKEKRKLMYRITALSVYVSLYQDPFSQVLVEVSSWKFYHKLKNHERMSQD